MKKRNMFLCLVLVLFICIVMAGCSSTSSESVGRNDTGKADNQAWNDPSKPEDQTWSDPENYESQSWSDPENPNDQDWRDTENPGTEATNTGESDHTGTYRHEIDGIVFYTEHDLEQWITRIPGGRRVFDLDRMVKDIFGEDAMGGNGYAFYGNGHFHLYNIDLNGNSSDNPKDGYYPCIQVDTLSIYDSGYGAGDEYYLPAYFFSSDSNKFFATEYEMLEIALYACEMWANEDTHYYAFENFEESQRFVVVRR